MKEIPQRKNIRIENYDYSTPGAYCVTVCTNKREKIFWNCVGADSIRPFAVHGSRFHETLGIPTGRPFNLAKILLRSRNPQSVGL